MGPGTVWPFVAASGAALAVWWALLPAGLTRLAAHGPPRGAGRVRLRRTLEAVGSVLLLWSPRQRRRRALLAAESATVFTLMAVCLDAGRPPRAALRIVTPTLKGPTREVLSDVLARIDLGLPESDAWLSLADTPGYAVAARDIARAVDSGLHLADTLRGHARDARGRTATEALVRARTASVRSVVPLMVCFLPAFLLLGVVPLFGAVVDGLAR